MGVIAALVLVVTTTIFYLVFNHSHCGSSDVLVPNVEALAEDESIKRPSFGVIGSEDCIKIFLVSGWEYEILGNLTCNWMPTNSASKVLKCVYILP